MVVTPVKRYSETLLYLVTAVTRGLGIVVCRITLSEFFAHASVPCLHTTHILIIFSFFPHLPHTQVSGRDRLLTAYSWPAHCARYLATCADAKAAAELVGLGARCV